MNLSAKILLISALLAAFTGCTSLEEKHQRQQIYWKDSSFAQNIVHQMELNVPDTDAPKDMPASAAERFRAETAVNASLHAAAGTFKGFSPIFLVSLGEMLSSEYGPEAHNAILFYLPDDGKMTPKDAAQTQILALRESFEKLFEARQKDYRETDVGGIFHREKDKRYTMMIDFMGPTCARILSVDGVCTVPVAVSYAEDDLYKINIPGWIDPASPLSWKNRKISVGFYKKNISRWIVSPFEYAFFQDLAAFLPGNVFIYAAARSKPAGKNPPMVFDNRKVHFFVKPQKQ